MQTSRTTLTLLTLATLSVAAQAQNDLGGHLVLADQGSFFVGGEVKTVESPAGPTHVTVNQMYVQYQVPPDGDAHVPVVMVHGCCLSSKTWETTPDGRMGWSEYFVRRGRPVYLADQVSRARSGFDATIINAVRNGNAEASALPNVLMASHEIAWQVFRFGPSFGTPFPDGQFPIEAVDELYKQMIPDLNSLLPSPNPTWTNMAALAAQLDGAVLMGHSESGFFPEQAALIDPSGVRGIVSIEMGCPTDLGASALATLARIPTLIMFGDYLDEVSGGPANWQNSFETCQTFIGQVRDAGGDALMMYLPDLGIHGNSHMLMQDRNSNELAELVLEWIDERVE
jgi:pimeloyl-ACP methyl ester carboxylesterase